MLWLGVHLPDFGLEIFTREATPQAHAVTSHQSAHTSPRVLLQENRVVLRNQAAIQAGISQGTTLATAHSIAPDLTHHHRDTALEHARLQLLAETLYQFTSQVSLQPPNGLLLEISGSLRLFGTTIDLSNRVRLQCEALGHRALISTDKTPLAALLLARSQASRIDAVSLHQVQWPASVPPGMTEQLANMGIHTLGALLKLPQGELAHRFGVALTDFLSRLSGKRPDPQSAIEPSETFISALHLPNPINSKDALRFPMSRLLGELQAWLVGRQLGAERTRWCFTSGNGRTASFEVALSAAQQRRDAFLELTCLKLEGADLPDDVLNLELKADALAPWLPANTSLFGEGSSGQSSLGELLNHLRARMGERSCSGVRSATSHPPEHAWLTVPPDDMLGLAQKAGKAVEHALPKAPTRPLWLFDPAKPIDPDALVILRGPERIQGAWWDSFIQRDYYVARHKNGAECWAYVDQHRHWYLHGYFA